MQPMTESIPGQQAINLSKIPKCQTFPPTTATRRTVGVSKGSLSK